MIQGVLPPLTAITNDPRAATAARASLAINLAASRATESASEYTSIFIRSCPSGARPHLLRLERCNRHCAGHERSDAVDSSEAFRQPHLLRTPFPRSCRTSLRRVSHGRSPRDPRCEAHMDKPE